MVTLVPERGGVRGSMEVFWIWWEEPPSLWRVPSSSAYDPYQDPHRVNNQHGLPIRPYPVTTGYTRSSPLCAIQR